MDLRKDAAAGAGDGAVTIELNVDLGELEGEPEALWAAATVVNVACGGHAGDAASMRRALALAVRHRAALAAHPSYPDREGFGRRARFVDSATAAASARAQCLSLAAVARELGATVTLVKPHGALYHDASTDPELAVELVRACAEAVPELRVVVGPPGSALEPAARALGLAFAREGFADRRYDAAGRLVPRTEPGALLDGPEACVAQALALARSGRFDTLCLHGDTSGAARLAAAVRAALEREGWLAGSADGDREPR